jgi:hypothetical protein
LEANTPRRFPGSSNRRRIDRLEGEVLDRPSVPGHRDYEPINPGTRAPYRFVPDQDEPDRLAADNNINVPVRSTRNLSFSLACLFCVPKGPERVPLVRPFRSLVVLMRAGADAGFV